LQPQALIWIKEDSARAEPPKVKETMAKAEDARDTGSI